MLLLFTTFQFLSLLQISLLLLLLLPVNPLASVETETVAAYAWALVALDNTEPGVDWIRSRELADTYSQGLTGKQRADAHELAARLIAEIGG